MIVTSAAPKTAAGGVVAALAATGLTPADARMSVAIVIGIAVGIVTAWSRERQAGRHLKQGWLVYQIAAATLIFLVVLWRAEASVWSVKQSAALAGVFAFSGFEGLNALSRRVLRAIEGPTEPVKDTSKQGGDDGGA